MEEILRVLVSLALALLLIVLRSEAETFGAAEYLEPTRDGRRASALQRLSYFLVGFALVGGICFVHPDPPNGLGLALGDRATAIVVGFLLGTLGTLQAIGFAYLRYRRLRFPPAWTYPGALLNSVGTAFLDEVTFRGVVLSMVMLVGINPGTAVIFQALLYTLATRVGAPGRHWYSFVLTLALGLATGWATVATGAIGAAFLGHAITRFAVFLFTGHAGQVARPGQEIEETWEYVHAPAGWRSVDEPSEPQEPAP